jgi:PAS domain S-box-containing protein
LTTIARHARSVRGRLVRLAVLLLLPGLAISVLLTWRTFVTARAGAETALREAARGLDQLVDREFIQAETLLRTLAATDELRTGRMADFDRLARATLVMGGDIVLEDEAGCELIDTGLPAGAALPCGPRPEGWDQEVVGSPVISPLAPRRKPHGLAIRIMLPVGVGGRHTYDLMLIVPTSSMQAILAREALPPGWVASIMDTSRLIVARTSDPARFVGQPAGPGVRAGLSESDEGVRDGMAADGTRVVLAFSRSPHSRWTVAVASPRHLIAEAGEQSASLLFGLGSAAILTGLLGALRAARSISRPIEALAVSAQALGEHETWTTIPPGLAEADAVARAMAAAARRLIERREALRELNATLALRVQARTQDLAAANTALAEERARLGQILDEMPIGVLVHGVDGDIAFANLEARNLLGLPPQGSVDGAAWPVIRRGQTVLSPEERPSALARTGISSARTLVTVLREPGGPVEVEISASPLRDSAGNIVLSVTTLQDVTARLEAEEARRRSQRLEAIGQLTGGVAHEFNNLLMAISGCLDLLAPLMPAGAAAGSRAPALLANAARATERGGRLTRQLLAFARQQHLRIEPVDLNRLVSGMKELLEGTLGGSVRVICNLEDGAWPALADLAQLELVLLNLAINARDAMPAGGELTICTLNARTGPPFSDEDPPQGEFVVLQVSDTGLGMPPAVLARAFEPFFTTKDAGRGSGLGLPQVLGVAQQLGGGVTISSVTGQGTSVKVFLPRARQTPDSTPRATLPSPATAALNIRLLLVDDDADVREIARAMLEEMGAAVIEAESGAAALLELRTSTVDLVLADFAMPGMSGIELAAEIAATLPALPVVLMTGYGEATMTDTGPHVRAVLQKPFRADILARTLTLQLAPREAPEPLEVPAGD